MHVFYIIIYISKNECANSVGGAGSVGSWVAWVHKILTWVACVGP